METKPKPKSNGFVVVNGVPYRRSMFTAKPEQSAKDWLLFVILLVGMGFTVLLTVALAGVLVWGLVGLAGAIAREIGQLRG